MVRGVTSCHRTYRDALESQFPIKTSRPRLVTTLAVMTLGVPSHRSPPGTSISLPEVLHISAPYSPMLSIYFISGRILSFLTSTTAPGPSWISIKESRWRKRFLRRGCSEWEPCSHSLWMEQNNHRNTLTVLLIKPREDGFSLPLSQ